MMGTSHALSGATTWVAGAAALSAAGVTVGLPTVAAGAILCAGAALLPDLDHPKSRAARSLGPLTRGLACLIGGLCGHRGATHYLIGAPIVGVPVGLLACLVSPALWWLGLAIGVGYAVHILGDACTDSGVPLWGPWSTRRRGLWRPLRFKTGDRGARVEVWLVRPGLVVVGLAAVAVLVS